MTAKHFIQYITYERRYSGNTIKAYSKDLEAFQQFLQTTFEQNNLASVTTDMIRTWVVMMMDEGISSAYSSR